MTRQKEQENPKKNKRGIAIGKYKIKIKNKKEENRDKNITLFVAFLEVKFDKIQHFAYDGLVLNLIKMSQKLVVLYHARHKCHLCRSEHDYLWRVMQCLNNVQLLLFIMLQHRRVLLNTVCSYNNTLCGD